MPNHSHYQVTIIILFAYILFELDSILNIILHFYVSQESIFNIALHNWITTQSVGSTWLIIQQKTRKAKFINWFKNIHEKNGN